MPDTPNLQAKKTGTVSRRAAIGFLGGVAGGATNAAAGGGAYIHDGDPLIEDIGAAERIGAADALRTLAQEATASACFLFHGVEPDSSRAVLIAARKEFRRNYDAILLGNPAMNIIGQEEHRRTLTLLQKLESAWQSVDGQLGQLLDNPANATALDEIRAQTKPLFQTTEELVSTISGQYSHPAELIQRDAIMIDIAGRQSRLTQEIAGHACDIWSSDESGLAKDALESAMATFDATLTSLRYGLPDLDLKAAPTDDIATRLDGVISDWSETKVLLSGLLDDTKFPEEARATLFRRMSDKTQRLEDLAHIYVTQAKHPHR